MTETAQPAWTSARARHQEREKNEQPTPNAKKKTAHARSWLCAFSASQRPNTAPLALAVGGVVMSREGCLWPAPSEHIPPLPPPAASRAASRSTARVVGTDAVPALTRYEPRRCSGGSGGRRVASLHARRMRRERTGIAVATALSAVGALASAYRVAASLAGAAASV